MALAFKISDLTAAPEALRSLYVQKDGGYVLDVEGVVPESDVKGLKAKNDELLAEKKKLLGQYNEILETQKLTDAQRAELQGKVDELEKQVMTADELAAKKVRQAKDEAASEVAKVKADADHFKGLYTTSTIEGALVKAAQEHGAVNAGQVHGLLAGRTVLEPVLDDDGKPTGRYEPKTTVVTMDGDKRVEKVLPAGEAVKAFLGLPENKNLVQTNFQPGGGATGGQASRGGVSDKNLSSVSKIEAGLKALGV
ncbi:hypothetical protein JCM15519_06980 [Fundidesulfovibrio butyratiphilus]